MLPFHVPAYHSFNDHYASSICKATLMDAQTARKQYHISHPKETHSSLLTQTKISLKQMSL